ncbi:MAG: hypothetical protein KKE89_06010, partial [Actinobacteria bacterium]|nr:hypothetical protein [Actinomycetota bacterium]
HPSDTYQGKLLPIEAFYASSTFGWTEDSEHGFTAYVPYLRSVEDHWALDPAVGNHSARWTREFSGSSLAARLPGMSTVTGLQVTACSDSGAALEITFTGSGGPRTFTTRSLRGYLGLRSMQIIRAGSPLPAKPACPQPGVTPTPTPGGPVVLAGMTLDDDNGGDSVGNGDGKAQCGEVVEVFTTLTNEGEGLTGVVATLSSADPYVSVRWNTTSTYPNLSAGASAANDGDWDLAIAANAPTAHQASLSMRVTADNGGPWDLDIAFPVTCRTVDAVASIGIEDLDGNGSPDIVTAVEARTGRPILKARDAETGAITGRVGLGRPGWDVVDLTPVPGSPSRIAALVTAANGTTRVVVADLATGKRVASVRFGPKGDPVAVAVVPRLKKTAAGLAVLLDFGEGRSRIAARTLDGALVTNRGIVLDPIDLERLDDLGATGAAEVAVLGTNGAGLATTITLDLRDGTRFSTTSLSAAPAVDLEALRGPGSDTINTLAVLQQLDGEALVTLIDPVTGEVLRKVKVPVAGAVDLEITPPLDGGEGEAVAVFGLSPDGVATAIVADPSRARLISGPVFAPGTTPIDLAVLVGYGPSGVTLAALGSTSASTSSIVLRDAISGVALGTLRVP